VKTLRRTLLSNSLAIIAAIVSVTVLLVAVYTSVLRQERRFGDVILLEQGLVERANTLVRSYNDFRNASTPDHLAQYTAVREAVLQDVERIRLLMHRGSGRIAFDGVDNTFQVLIAALDAGVRAVHVSDVGPSTAAYEEGSRILVYLPETVSHLVSEELNVSRPLRAEAARRQRIVLYVGGALLVLVIVAATAAAVKLSRGVSAPIEKLSRISRDVAAGTYDVHIEPVPADSGEEVAELSRSFSVMVENLRQTVDGLRKSNDLLEKLNNLFVTREQRIRELKEQLQAAGQHVADDPSDRVDSTLKGV